MTKTSIYAAPTEEPIDLDEVKLALHIDSDADNLRILRLLRAARFHIENEYRLAIMAQTVDCWYDAFPELDSFIILPKSPASTVAVTLFSKTSVESTWAAANYQLDTNAWPSRLVLAPEATWPTDELRSANGIRARLTCGWANKDAVPEDVRQALLLLITHWYEQPKIVEVGHLVNIVPYGLESLMRNYRPWLP